MTALPTAANEEAGMWTAEVYPSSGFVVLSGEGNGMFPAELDEGTFDNRFHELWLGLASGEVFSDWGFERLAEHREAPADGRFLRFYQPDGSHFTLQFRRDIPDDRLDLWLRERLAEHVSKPQVPDDPEPEPAADEPEPKEKDDALRLGESGPVPASGGRPRQPGWIWKPEIRSQDAPGVSLGEQKRGRGRPRKHPVHA